MADQDRLDYCKRRLSALQQERESFISHYKELSEFIEPRRGRFFVSDRNKGERRHNAIVNSRATQAHRTAQSGMFAGIMSPTRPWFKFETIDPEMMKSSKVKDWMYKVERLIGTIFLDSNLYNMAPVMLGELLLFATAAMSHVDDYNDVARFYTHTAGSYYIAQNDKFEVDTFALERELSVKQIVDSFGIKNVSSYVKNQYDKGNYDAWYPVVQLIEPNKNADGSKEESKYKNFASIWYEPGNNEKDMFLRRSGFSEFPVHVARWAVAGEDIYGTNCPAMVALGDTKGLQIMEKRKAQAVDKLVNPPLKAPPSVRNVPISSLPGGLNIYDSDSTKEGLTTLYQVDPRLNEMRADIQAIEQRINEAFFVDLFLAISMMEGIQPKNQMELIQRNEERLMMLGPPLERIQQEVLGNLITRTFNQALRAGILPPAPEELQGTSLNVRYISALAMAQRAVEVTAIERTVMFATQLAAVKPNVLDSLDADEALRQFTQMTGTVPSLIIPPDVVAEKRQHDAEMQQAAMKAEVQANQAQAANSGASAVKQLSEAGGG